MTKAYIVLNNFRQNSPNITVFLELKNGVAYSTQRLLNSENIFAVKLDKNDLQHFYSQNYQTKITTELIANLKVVYPTLYEEITVIVMSIINDSLDLFISDLKAKTNIYIAKNVRGSVLKILIQ